MPLSCTCTLDISLLYTHSLQTLSKHTQTRAHTIIEDMKKKYDINPSRRYVLIRKVIPSIRRGSERAGRGKKKNKQINSYIIKQSHHQHSTPTGKQRCTYTNTHTHSDNVTGKAYVLSHFPKHTDTHHYHSKACTDANLCAKR